MKLTMKSDRQKKKRKDEQPQHLKCNILKASTAEKYTNYFKQSDKDRNKQVIFGESQLEEKSIC